MTALDSPLAAASDVHWLVRSDFAEQVRGDARVSRVWDFPRGGKWSELRALARELVGQDFDHVIDLHSSLRSRALRRLMRLEGFSGEWRRVRKERWRSWGLFTLKKLWPRALSPRPWIDRFREAASRSVPIERRGPDLTAWVQAPARDRAEIQSAITQAGCVGYFAVAPSSAWPGKEWGVDGFAELLRIAGERTRLLPVVLGTASDETARELVAKLVAAQTLHFSGVGRWDVREAARVMAGSVGLLGVDSGLVHLAEGVGRAVFVLQGPTNDRVGFAPWRAESASFGAELWCRPCSKDGTACFRPGAGRFLCLRGLSAGEVARAFLPWLERQAKARP